MTATVEAEQETEGTLTPAEVVTYDVAEETEEMEDSVLDEETTDDSGIEAMASQVPIYRLYYPGNGEHLYTTDVNEKNTLYNDYGWGYEGIAWYASSSGKAVYRLYHPGLGNHLYTTDTNEVKVLTTKHGWKKDNNGKALFYSSGNVPIYRVVCCKTILYQYLIIVFILTDIHIKYNTLYIVVWE